MTWSLTLPFDPYRRPDPEPSLRTDPDAILRRRAGLPAKATRGLRNDPDYDRWLGLGSLFVRTHRPRPMFTGPVLLVATFHVRCSPKLPLEMRGLPHATTPDLDRYLHALQDLLTQGEVWTDDRLVAASLPVKVWAMSTPCIDVLVAPWDGRVAAMLEIARGYPDVTAVDARSVLDPRAAAGPS